MTMHLVGPYLTTTRYNSKKKPSNSQKLAKAKAEHDEYLKRMGIGKSPMPVDKKGRRVSIHDMPDLRAGITSTVKLSNTVAGSGTKIEEKRYTGTLIKGIATMHKSNAVPIMNKEQAIDISNMRRN